MSSRVGWMVAGVLAAMAVDASEVEVRLADLDLSRMTSGWGKPLKNHSVRGRPLRIAGREYDHGVGVHAESLIRVRVPVGPARFCALVGVDDAAGEGAGSVEFVVLADGVRIWRSGVMRAGMPAASVDLDVSGREVLVLRVVDAGDGTEGDLANWVMAVFHTWASGAVALSPIPDEPPIVLTPPPPPSPRINGARVFGARPGNPFLFTIAASGDRPMTFHAHGLPAGIALDESTGILSGTTPPRGDYRIVLGARNAAGAAERELRVMAGDRLALTPPMGWNSWNVFGSAVTRAHVEAAAEAMVRSGLIRHGWTYVNIDDFWTVMPESDDPTLQGPARDKEGSILPNPRFPDMKGLVARIHALGLKAGIYSSPGPLTCGGCVGSHGHERLDAERYADWGFDYLKYDWCTYTQIARGGTLFELMNPYFIMRDALLAQSRDIVYSLCQYGMGNVSAWGATVGGHAWRTTGDIEDTWTSVRTIGFSQRGLEHFAGPGRWNDPDMLVVGRLGWSADPRPTRLTPNEQYAHISLWSLLAAPLLLGCDLDALDEFTLNLLTNDEVIEVNQDPLGRQATRVAERGPTQVWTKPMKDGSLAVGLFNLDEEEQLVAAIWPELGVHGPRRVRDVWRQADLGVFDGRVERSVPRHGCVLVRLFPLDD